MSKQDGMLERARIWLWGTLGRSFGHESRRLADEFRAVRREALEEAAKIVYGSRGHSISYSADAIRTLIERSK